MDEKQENNIYKPKIGGIMLAGILLFLVVAVIAVVVIVLAKGPSTDNPAVTGDPEKTVAPGSNGSVSSGTSSETVTTAVPDTDPVTPGGVTVDEIVVDSVDLHKGPLILVNADHPFRIDTEMLIPRSEMAKLSASALLETYNFKNVYGTGAGNYKVKATTGFYLDVDALSAFNKMMAAYVEEKGNTDVQLRNAYYYDAAEELCHNATGLVVDLEIYSLTKMATYPLKYSPMKADYYDWFVDNCYKYGFIHLRDVKTSNGEEKYSSFRYVGIGNAAAIKTKGLNLESYIELIKGYRFENRLVFSAGGSEYWAYYVPATGTETAIKTVGRDYVLSGNNIDGFVVALNASELGS